jgi:uncharacterized damage-inducible protein DinB
MTEIQRIVDQLNRAFYEHAWHGPTVMDAVRGVTAVKAASRPIPKAHTIWEITHHIAIWKEVVRKRILGERVHMTDDYNFPLVVKPTPAAWKQVLARLTESHESLVEIVKKLPESRLSDRPKRGANTFYVQIHGVVQHDLYHAGQIVLLKKAR